MEAIIITNGALWGSLLDIIGILYYAVLYYTIPLKNPILII